MKRKRRKWLYEQYKIEHPEAFPAQKQKKQVPGAVIEICRGLALFIMLNFLAILIAAAISADLRAIIF